MAHYLAEPPYRHGSPALTAVLLINLGTPDAPTAPAVRRYLGEFLADARVGETFQFERLGYFRADEDSKPGAPVFNRTVTLKDSWAKDAPKH